MAISTTTTGAAGRASIATTITNTAVGFTLIGLVTVLGMLVLNAVMVFSTLTDFPIPDIKTVAVKGLEDGPARVFLDLEFPGRSGAGLISAQTEGPIEVSVFVGAHGEALPKKASLSVVLPSGFNLNLASKEATSLVIDDLQIKFGEDFNAALFSTLADRIIAGENLSKLQNAPNVMVQVKTRVVVKSLMIPLGASLDWPFKIDLGKIIREQAAKKTKKAEIEESKSSSSSKEIEIQGKSAEKSSKEKALKDFDFMPRYLKVEASDKEKFEIVAVLAIPTLLIPEFLTVEVPAMSFQAGLYRTTKKELPEERKVEKFIQISIDPFLVQSQPSDATGEVQVRVSLLMDKAAAGSTQKLLELVRDKKSDYGVQLKQEDSFLATRKAGGLTYWLKDFVLNIPIGSLLAEHEAEQKTKKAERLKELREKTKARTASANEATTDNSEKIPTDTSKAINVSKDKDQKKPKRVVAIKFVKAERAASGDGGSFHVSIDVKHSIAKFLVGKLPELNFQAQMGDGNHLLALKVSSSEITPKSKKITILLELSFSNLRQMVFLGLRAAKLSASPELAEKIPELATMNEIVLSAASSDMNILSQLASVFDLSVRLGPDGLESVQFVKAPTVQLYKANAKPTPEEEELAALEKMEKKEASPVVDDSKEKKSFKRAVYDAKFAIQNVNDNLSIGAALDIPKSIFAYASQYCRLSWMEFGLAMKYKSHYLFDFKIHPGYLNIGLPTAVPLSATFGTGILIPADFDSLENLSGFLKNFMDESGQLLDLDFEIRYGAKDSELPPIKLEATIPNKALLQPKPTKDDGPTKDETDKATTEAQTIPGTKRTDFLDKVKNSVISFVSIQAPTLFFHLTYPNGNYCSPKGNDFDMKINVLAVLPVIEANVCGKEGRLGQLKCFASAGLSRPMRLRTEIIDGQICQVSSEILPANVPLAGSGALKRSTTIKYSSNEIPVHVSITDLAALVRFAEMAGAKRQQFLTIGPVHGATNINKFVGVVVSSLISIEIPDKSSTTKKEQVPDKTPEKDPINVLFNPDSPAIMELGTSSVSKNELELLLGFRLPPQAHEGIRTILSPETMFNWPMLQWGMFDFTIGIEKMFEAKISLKRGQIDLKEEGVVVSALDNFAMRIHLKTHESVQLGSTALRQILGTLNNYFKTPKDQRRAFDRSFIANSETTNLFYKFAMKGPRGLNDPEMFFAEGETRLKEILNLADVIINRPALPMADEADPQTDSAQSSDSSSEKEQEIPKKNPFERVLISMRTVANPNNPQTKLPCLIPALCNDEISSTSTASSSTKPSTSSQIGLVFQLKNVLRPIIGIVGSQIGPVLQNFKMTNYPSHLEMRYTGLTDVWLTFMLNGAGIVSLGLTPIQFSRDALIKYTAPTNLPIIPASSDELHHNIDIIEVGLNIRFPSTIKGLRSTFNVFRRETLLMPAIPPIIFSPEKDGKFIQQTLSNAPFHLALSSDDLDNADGNNLLSALMAAAMPETIAPALNPTDEMLHSFYDEVPKDVKTDSTPKPQEVETTNAAVLERGALDMGNALGLVTCIVTGFKCDTQFDLAYNVKLPFAVKMLRFILPATSIFRVYVDEAPIIQYVADARKQNHLYISPAKGVDILGSASVCLTGLDKERFPKTDKTMSYLSGKSGTAAPIKFQVIFGSDVNLSAELDFPFYKIRSMAVKKFKSWIPDVSGMVGNFWSYFTKSTDEELIGFINSPAGITTLPASQISLARPERRQCLTNDLSNKEKNHRLKEIEYKNTAIFYEADHAVIVPKTESKVFIQLRTKDEEVVCGQPAETRNFKLILRLLKREQGFMSLKNVFSYQAPVKDETFSFDATFNHALNLFETNINLPHTGRYDVSIKYGEKTVDLPNTVIYAKHAY